MCFSATASFSSGTVLVVIGIATLLQVKYKYSIPFASIPLIFGIQQIIEGMVWISFQSIFFHSIVVNMFVFIAYAFWPIFAPISILLMEKNLLRRKILWIISFIGALIGISLFVFIVLGPVTSNIVSNSICYNVPVSSYPIISFLLYFIAVTTGSIVSSFKKIRIFGTAVLVSFFIAHIFYPETSFSVWCFFSAILSIIIYFHMKDLKKLYLSN